ILNVYDSQLDYREGFSPYYVGGTNTREYKTPGQASYWEWEHFSESGKFHGVDGTTWCYAFTQWAHAMAGIPLTLRSDSYEWKDFTCAGGSYAPQPGDIIGVGATHLAMIGSALMQDGYMQIQIINGNHPHRNVGKELLRYDPVSGKALFIYEDGAWQELNSEDSADYKIRSLYCPRLSEIVTHTLSLDAGEGTAAWSSRPIAEDAVYGALPEAKRTGYVFDGWYTEKTGGEKALPYRMFQKKADQTLYAHYTAKPDAVAAVHINEENVSVERKAAQQITVSFTPENAADQTVSWRSSNTDVARISAEGIVRGVAAGTAVIEARGADSSDVAYLSVTVTEPSSQSGNETPKEEPKPKEEDLVSYAVEGGSITFDKSTGTITKAEQTITAAEIPASIEGVAVKAIGKEAFYKCSSLSSVSLPEGMETIGQSTFEETALVHVTVPDSVKRLEKWSFCVIKTLEDAVIGSGVEYIGEWAFSQDSALKTVYFKKDWNEIEIETEHKAFTSNPEFKLYDSGSGKNPEKPGDNPAPTPKPVDDGEYIPQDERDISDKAKYKINGLEWEFSKRSGTITSIPRAWVGGRLPESIDGTPVSYVGDRAGSSRDKILTLVIPEGVKGIDAHAFQSCQNLEYLGLPASLSHINERAFQFCYQLEDISYAGDWRNLQCGYFAFRNCLFQRPDFSEPYKGSPYYENLKKVKLTGDFVEDVMTIAQSQEGYHEGDRFEELDGSNPNGRGEYAEMNYFTGSPDWLWHPDNYEQDTYGGWCGDFCKWAYAMAGAPAEVMDVYAYEHQTGHQWNTSVYAGGTYSLKRGDLIHFDYGHYAMVIEPPVKSSSEGGDVLTIQTWNGNPAVEKRTYVVKAADGLLLTVDGKPYGDGSKNYYLAWYCPVNTEAAKDVKSYNVTFDAAGGTVDAAGKTVYDGASYGLLPQAEKDGFTFGGWYTGKSGRGKWITPYRTVRLDEDVTLYAKWIAADEKVWKDPEDSETSMDLVSETGGSVECVYDAATGLVTVGVVPEGKVFVACYDESGRMLSAGAVSGSGGEVKVDGSSQNISAFWLDEGYRPKCGKQGLELAG
ncbi:MAG: leucine-rich repeat protein, partial [Oscillibacter sp.]|nr:leucine-rich repeat protein [Oscillibacter sp.]